MEVKKRHTAQVIFHASGGIRRSGELRSQLASERRTLKLKGDVPPAVRKEILWK